MCMICVDFQKQKMTINDARRAFREMSSDMDPEHAREVRKMLRKAEQEQKKTTTTTPSSSSSP